MRLSQGLAEQAVAVRSTMVRVQLGVLTTQSERPLMNLHPLTQNPEVGFGTQNFLECRKVV